MRSGRRLNADIIEKFGCTVTVKFQFVQQLVIQHLFFVSFQLWNLRVKALENSFWFLPSRAFRVRTVVRQSSKNQETYRFGLFEFAKKWYEFLLEIHLMRMMSSAVAAFPPWFSATFTMGHSILSHHVAFTIRHLGGKFIFVRTIFCKVKLLLTFPVFFSEFSLSISVFEIISELQNFLVNRPKIGKNSSPIHLLPSSSISFPLDKFTGCVAIDTTLTRATIVALSFGLAYIGKSWSKDLCKTWKKVFKMVSKNNQNKNQFFRTSLMSITPTASVLYPKIRRFL